MPEKAFSVCIKDSIFIDPPYNTGNEGWVYNDNVNDPHIKAWLNKTVGKEGEDLSRHDKWLCMMYPRLKLLQKLLAEDGAIFISIDDAEFYNLRMICNAESKLSVEMLNNLNPSFVLDLTATPRKNSNIISYVDARDLKKEHMVKFPVVVYNRTTRQSVIQDAIQLRGSIEKEAIAAEAAGGKYIRPIVLFQAQPRTGDGSDTFDKIKAMLVNMGIPEAEIAVKTSNVDDLKGKDIMSRDCQIRYIITVNALKEGWDCPFAYILASLANRTSTVDVEQILGRILRQPYAMEHKSPLLNTSYVLTNSVDFHTTLEKIVTGLNKAGFSRKDYRLGDTVDAPQLPVQPEVVQTAFSMEPQPGEADTFADVNVQEVRAALESATPENTAVSAMVQEATQQAESYTAAANGPDDGFFGGELGDMLKQNAMQLDLAAEVSKLRIPQFFLRSAPDLFGGEYELLEPENLSDGFSLAGQDAQVRFELATGEMYRVDVAENGEAVPKYKRADSELSEYHAGFILFELQQGHKES